MKEDLDALIVGVLGGEALHGYAIAGRIRLRSRRALRPGEGLIYPVLHRLAEDGVLGVQWVAGEGRPARKAYALADGVPMGGAQALVQRLRLRFTGRSPAANESAGSGGPTGSGGDYGIQE